MPDGVSWRQLGLCEGYHTATPISHPTAFAAHNVAALAGSIALPVAAAVIIPGATIGTATAISTASIIHFLAPVAVTIANANDVTTVTVSSSVVSTATSVASSIPSSLGFATSAHKELHCP